VRFDDEAHAGFREPRGERLPVGYLEHHAKVRNRHVVPVDRIDAGGV
jgi:hypothetical protein